MVMNYVVYEGDVLRDWFHGFCFGGFLMRDFV